VHWSGNQAITQVGTSVVTGAGTGWNRGSYGPYDILYNPNGSGTLVIPTDAASVWANKYVMYYDGTSGSDEAMGLAVSNDGINWEGYDGGAAPVLDSGPSSAWDSGYVGYGTVIEVGDSEFDLCYSGGQASASALNEGIGFAASTDGIDWVKSASNPIFSIHDGVTWRDERTYTPMVIGNQMWFSGVGPDGYAIGYAEAETPVPEPATFGAGVLGVAPLLAALWGRLSA